MQKTVYFHIDELARDAVTAANLKRILAEKGVETVYGNKENTKRLLYSCRHAFDAVILPKVTYFQHAHRDVDKPFPPVITLLTEANGTLSNNLEWGAKNVLGGEFFINKDIRWAAKIKAHCLWGPAQLKAVEHFAPELVPNFHVTGHPRHDLRCWKGAEKPSQSGKIRIGLISRLKHLAPFSGTNLFEHIFLSKRKPAYRHAEGLDIEDAIYTEVIDLRLFLEFIGKLDTDKYEISVRPHPREDRHMWQGLIDNYDLPVTVGQWDEPFMHWLGGLDYAVGPASTGFYDCFVAGKNPICTNMVFGHRQPHTHPNLDDNSAILEFVRMPKSMDELLELVAEKPEPGGDPVPEGARKILEFESNLPHSANSLDEVARICLEVLESTPEPDPTQKRLSRLKYDFKNWDFNRCEKRRRRIKGYEEQGGKFLLTRKRIEWIDSLVGRD